jgi:CHAT domain-containing protein
VEGADLPLLRDHEIVFAPSASVLLALRKEGAATGLPSSTTVAVVADPVFESADPRVAGRRGAPAQPAPVPLGLTRAMERLGGDRFVRLPFSRGEAEAIARLVPPSALLKAVDFAANRALVTEGALSDRRVVHFATHGLLDSEHPDLSGLVLSLVDDRGRPRDGFLRMQEVYNLRLPAELVVLSACQTALGREIRGEGLVGLTRGFIYAGARRVVASLWQVDDESTAALMKRFYRALLKDGRRPADALRVAQLEMSQTRRWSAPFYWAGFVLQGEWR